MPLFMDVADFNGDGVLEFVVSFNTTSVDDSMVLGRPPMEW